MKKGFIIIAAMLVLVACGSREERNKKAEDKGQAVVEEKSSFIKGVGDGLKGLGKDAAESLSEGVGEVLKGANEGFDKSLVKIDTQLSDNLKEIITVSRTETHTNDSLKKEIIVYTVFEKNFEGKFILKAFNKNNEEIGRSVISLKEQADNSRFVEFPFDERTSFSLIHHLVLDMK